MKWPIVALALVACHHHVDIIQDSHIDQVLDDHARATEDLEQHAQAASHETSKQGPTEISATSSAEKLGVLIQDQDGGLSIARVPEDRPLPIPKGSRIVGAVPLEKSAAQSTEKIGPASTEKDTGSSVDTKKHLQSADDKHGELNGEQHGEEHRDTGIGFDVFFWLEVGLCVAAAAAVGIWIAWKLKPPWLGWLWKLFGQ